MMVICCSSCMRSTLIIIVSDGVNKRPRAIHRVKVHSRAISSCLFVWDINYINRRVFWIVKIRTSNIDTENKKKERFRWSLLFVLIIMDSKVSKQVSLCSQTSGYFCKRNLKNFSLESLIFCYGTSFEAECLNFRL